jgi:hypothetical protein
MKVSDFDVVFGNGVFNCCFDDIKSDNSPAREGMIIECNECGQAMKLTRCKDGVLRWVAD